MNHIRPTTVVISTIAVGAIAVSSGVAAQTAFAATDYPSWSDVQNAKKNEADTQAAISKITDLVTGLQRTADQASTGAMLAGEKYSQAQAARDAQAETLDRLQKKADEAQATALTSRMRAGLLASHLARAGGQDLTASLFTGGEDAEQLLQSLGTMSKLSQNTQAIYQQALSDRNTAASLSDQAQVAKDELARLADEAQKSLDDANAAAAAASSAVAEQQKNSDQLIAQLALLKDSTAAIEAQYIQSLTPPAVPAASGGSGGAPSGGGSSSGGGGGGSSSGGGSGSGGSGPRPGGGGGSSGSVTPPPPRPAPGPAPAPSANAAQVAIAFAKAQLGDAYGFGGQGPNVWDCSGLVMMAYRAAGVNVGGHSVSSQYYQMQSQGRLVPFAERQAGDIIFWSSDGDFYHDAISLGGNTIIAAPKPGDVVKIQSLWGGSDIMPYVGRPG